MKRTIIAFVLYLPALAAADKSYTGGKGATWDCKKDPVVSINHGDGVYTFKGDCKAIHINGGSNTLTVDSVDVLDVDGGENTIKVTTVGSITVDGADNKVTWKKAKTGDKPAITNGGENNKIEQIK